MPGNITIIPARAAEDPALHHAALRVLLTLGTYTDREGYCYPSQSSLARRLRVSRQAVNRQVKNLERLGYLEVLRRKNRYGAETSCLYRICYKVSAVEILKEKRIGVRKDTSITNLQVLPAQFEENSLKLQDQLSSDSKISRNVNCLAKYSGPESGFSKEKSGKLTDIPSPLKKNMDAPIEMPSIAVPESPRVSKPAIFRVAQRIQLTIKLRKEKKEDLSKKGNTEKNASPSSTAKPPLQEVLIGESEDYSVGNRAILKKGSRYSDLEQSLETSIPRSPLEAHGHADIRLYIRLTSFTPPERDYEGIISVLHSLRTHYPSDQELATYLQPFWQKWCASRRKDGSFFSKANSAWLTDWAMRNVFSPEDHSLDDFSVSTDLSVFQEALDPKPGRCQ